MKKHSIVILLFLLLTQLRCSKNENSPEIQVLNLKNNEEKFFIHTFEGVSKHVRVKIDSIIDNRPPTEICSTIYTNLKYVQVYFEVQIENGKIDTAMLGRRMCIPSGKLLATDVNFSKKCVNGFCIGLQNVTEKSISTPVDIKNYSVELKIF